MKINNSIKKFFQIYGMYPEELSNYLAEYKITNMELSKIIGRNNSTIGKDFKNFHVVPYKNPNQESVNFYCIYCSKAFTKKKRNDPKFNKFCSRECQSNYSRGSFDEKKFKFNTNDFSFLTPSLFLGQYQNLYVNTPRNLDKFNHFFFRNGIHNEETACFFALMLTDGCVYYNDKKQFATISLKDSDLIEQLAKLINYKKKIRIQKEKYYTLTFHSKYLVNDLMALGCFPRKTDKATYPLIPNHLDKHFIRSCIDGDGSWPVTNKGQVFLSICGNDLLLYGIYKKIKYHLNINPANLFYPNEKNEGKMQSFCRISYNVKDSKLIQRWLYTDASYYGKRKYTNSLSQKSIYYLQMSTTGLAEHLGVSVDFIKTNLEKYPYLPVKITKGGFRYFLPNMITEWEDFLRERLLDNKSRLPNKKVLTDKWLDNKIETINK